MADRLARIGSKYLAEGSIWVPGLNRSAGEVGVSYQNMVAHSFGAEASVAARKNARASTDERHARKLRYRALHGMGRDSMEPM